MIFFWCMWLSHLRHILFVWLNISYVCWMQTSIYLHSWPNVLIFQSSVFYVRWSDIAAPPLIYLRDDYIWQQGGRILEADGHHTLNIDKWTLWATPMYALCTSSSLSMTYAMPLDNLSIKWLLIVIDITPAFFQPKLIPFVYSWNVQLFWYDLSSSMHVRNWCFDWPT